jgi:hypothetical protein
VNPSTVKRSSSLKSIVNNGLLAVIDEDDANKILNHPEAKEERERVTRQLRSSQNMISPALASNEEITLDIGSGGRSTAITKEQDSDLQKDDSEVDHEIADLASKITLASYDEQRPEIVNYLCRSAPSNFGKLASAIDIKNLNHEVYSLIDCAAYLANDGETTLTPEALTRDKVREFMQEDETDPYK